MKSLFNPRTLVDGPAMYRVRERACEHLALEPHNLVYPPVDELEEIIVEPQPNGDKLYELDERQAKLVRYLFLYGATKDEQLLDTTEIAIEAEGRAIDTSAFQAFESEVAVEAQRARMLAEDVSTGVVLSYWTISS